MVFHFFLNLHILYVHWIGAPTVEDASQILIKILDLKHPLTFDQPLAKLLQEREKQKRSSLTIPSSNIDVDECPRETQLGCYDGMLIIQYYKFN